MLQQNDIQSMASEGSTNQHQLDKTILIRHSHLMAPWN